MLSTITLVLIVKLCLPSTAGWDWCIRWWGGTGAFDGGVRLDWDWHEDTDADIAICDRLYVGSGLNGKMNTLAGSISGAKEA